MHYGIYNLVSGKLNQIGTCPDYLYSKQTVGIGQGIIELPEYSWDYWIDVLSDPHLVMVKAALPYSINKTSIVGDGVDVCFISGLPNPCTVTWPDGMVTIETDGEASFTLDQVGNYSVILDSIPHIKEVINVTATDPT